MSSLVFPAFAGLKIEQTREALPLTQLPTSITRVETPFSYETYPRYRYRLDIEVLRSDSSLSARIQEWQKLVGFHARMRGSLDTFLFTDDEDNTVAAHNFGVGNGTTTAFQLQRTLVASADLAAPASRSYWPVGGDGYEPIFDLNGNPSVFVNAGAQALGTDFTVSATALVQFLVQTPAAPTLTPSASGGSLATNTYFVKLTALGQSGETLAAPERSTAVTGPTGSIAVTWAAVTGATGYRIYVGTSSNGEGQFFTVGAVTSFTITTATGTAGTPPIAATALRAPLNGDLLTWSGSYYRRCRFESDSLPSTRIVQSMWAAQVSLLSIK